MEDHGLNMNGDHDGDDDVVLDGIDDDDDDDDY